jgi:type I restriction enzyme S subunit
MGKMVPEVRFKGFTEEWETRRLDKLYSFAGSGGTPTSTNESYYSGPIPFLAITDISNSNGYITDTEKHVSHEGLKHSTAWVVPAESISLAMYASVGKVAILKSDVATSQAFFNMVFNNIPLRNFVFQYLKKMETNNLWDSLVSTGTQSNLNAQKIKAFEISISMDEQEQQKIGNLFKEIDELIRLKGQELEKTTNMKKALLEKMFPKSGENVPELRFQGFSEEWESRRLNKLGNTYSGLSGLTKENFGRGNASYVTYMNVFLNPVSDLATIEKVQIDRPQNKVSYGDILFTTSSETPEEVGMSSVWVGKMDNIYLNSFCFGVHPFKNQNPYYLAVMFRSLIVRNKIQFLAQGISRFNISKNRLMEITVPFPLDAEQQKIGKLFRTLDRLLSLQKTELEKLNNMKKALLDKMFVSAEIAGQARNDEGYSRSDESSSCSDEGNTRNDEGRENE